MVNGPISCTSVDGRGDIVRTSCVDISKVHVSFYLRVRKRITEKKISGEAYRAFQYYKFRRFQLS